MKFIFQNLVLSLLTSRCQMRGIDRDSHFSFQNSVHIINIQTHWKNILQTSMWILPVSRSHTRRSLRGIPNLSFQIFILYLCENVRQKKGLLYTIISFWTLQIEKCHFDKKTYLQSLLLNYGLIGLRSGIQGNCRLHLICQYYKPLSRFIINTMSLVE